MKKWFVCLACALCMCISGFAQQKYLGQISQGSWAYFMDYRYSTTYARGYLVGHVDEDTTYVFCQTVDMTTGKRYPYIFATTLDENGEITLGGVDGLFDYPQELVGNLQQTMIDFLNYAVFIKDNSSKIDAAEKVLEDPWDKSYSQWYYCSSAVPFLNFTKITTDKKSTEPIIELCKLGFVTSFDQTEIDTFNNTPIEPFVEVDRASGSVPPGAKKLTIKENGHTATLDQNWELNKLGTENSYWLNIQSFREAQFTIEQGPDSSSGINTKSKDGKLQMAQLVLVYAVENLIPSSIKAKFDKNDLVIEYETYDENNWVTYTRIRIKNDVIINFSAYKDVYENNTKYFETILKSVK